MKHLIYLFSIALIFTACNSTNIVTIDVREPATISFPPDVTNILIVDNTPIIIPLTKEEENKTNEDIHVLKIDSAKKILISSLDQFMNEEKYFAEVKTYPYRTNNTREEVNTLSERKVQSICKEQGADAIISLDLFTISGQLESENTGYLESYQMLGAKLGTLVRVFSDNGELYSKPIIQLDSLYRESTSRWGKSKENTLLLNDLIAEICAVGADNLTSKFIPSWQHQNRWYYSSKSSKMKAAEKFAKTNKWEEATTIWKSLYEKENNKKKKARLASNIALAYEYLDKPEEALNWINKAHEQLPQKSNSDLSLQIMAYKSILDKRVESMPKLYEQLGIEAESENDQK